MIDQEQIDNWETGDRVACLEAENKRLNTALRRIAQSGAKPAADIARGALRQESRPAVPGVYREGQGN